MTAVNIPSLASSIDIRVVTVVLMLCAVFSSGCSTLYPPSVHLTGAPRAPAVDMNALACQPVLIFRVVAPSSIEWLGPTVSYALVSVLLTGSPPVWVVPTTEMLSRISDDG